MRSINLEVKTQEALKKKHGNATNLIPYIFFGKDEKKRSIILEEKEASLSSVACLFYKQWKNLIYEPLKNNNGGGACLTCYAFLTKGQFLKKHKETATEENSDCKFISAGKMGDFEDFLNILINCGLAAKGDMGYLVMGPFEKNKSPEGSTKNAGKRSYAEISNFSEENTILMKQRELIKDGQSYRQSTIGLERIYSVEENSCQLSNKTKEIEIKQIVDSFANNMNFSLNIIKDSLASIALSIGDLVKKNELQQQQSNSIQEPQQQQSNSIQENRNTVIDKVSNYLKKREDFSYSSEEGSLSEDYNKNNDPNFIIKYKNREINQKNSDCDDSDSDDSRSTDKGLIKDYEAYCSDDEYNKKKENLKNPNLRSSYKTRAKSKKID
jgi:hypothetical protein